MPEHPVAARGAWLALLAASLVSLASSARAAPTVSANGFSIHIESVLAAPPARAYRAFIHPALWWDAAHTYSHDARKLSLEPRAGGCFCERLAHGGSVEHLRVVFVQPGERLRLAGALGPMQPSGLAGALTVQFKPQGEGTLLLLDYVVGGYRAGGFDDIAPAAEGMLGEQVERLKQEVERGKASRRP